MTEEETSRAWREWKEVELSRLDADLNEPETRRQEAKERERNSYTDALLLIWWPVTVIAAFLIWALWDDFLLLAALSLSGVSFFLLVGWLGEKEGRRLEQRAAPSLLNTRSTYEAYLMSPEWKEKARQARIRAGNRCQLCNRRGALDVHHRTYDHIFHEKPEELIVLCRDCHKVFHDYRRVGR
jgi:hypothetical protein